MFQKLKRSAVNAITLSLMLVGTIAIPAAVAGGLPVTVAPLAPFAPQTGQCSSSDLAERRAVSIKRGHARITRAAICTEDLSQIAFAEYMVDWSGWMAEVAERWMINANPVIASGKFKPVDSACVQFTCNHDGTVRDVAVLSGSGDPLCDQHQIQALKSCVPLPKFPQHCKKRAITFLFVWDFEANERVSTRKSPMKAARSRQLTDTRVSISGKTM